MKVFTLGRFTIVKEDTPIQFSGKGQRKPLELLKAMISQGGKDVPEDRVTDLLWPDTEGDMAHQNFGTTLHRLRCLIGNDAVIKLQGRQLTIDARYCWVDTWAFERMAEPVARRGSSHYINPQSAGAEAVRLAEKAIGIYKGHFLPSDTGHPWTIVYRERLQDKFRRLVVRLSQYREDAGHYENAVECLWKGMEIDNLAEEFYQRLMVCYHRLGQEAEAVKTYRRCRSVLSATLGIEPSARTEAIYNALISRM